MNYWDLRKLVIPIVGRQQVFLRETVKGSIQEKGRKKNYQQFNLITQEWDKQERLLNTEEITSFLEVSLRAQACPMPLNLDTYDGLLCGYGCIYCFPSGTKILMADGTEKVIERVRKGDRIWAFDDSELKGKKAIVNGVMSRVVNEELITIELEDGKALEMTSEHPVFTKRGWIEAGNLNEDDEVLIW